MLYRDWENEGKINVNTGVPGPSQRTVSSLNKHTRTQFFDPVNTQTGKEEFLCPFCLL